MRFLALLVAALLAFPSPGLIARPLDAPKLSCVSNEAKIVATNAARPGTRGEVIRPDEKLEVGLQSRAELDFDDGTLARLGAETTVGFRYGSRELALERGTMLLEVPAFRGGARIHAGSLTASCGSATVLIEHLPAQSLKIVVLAGDLRVAVDGFLGDSIVVPPAKMLITAPSVKRIPDLVDVDLGTLARSSTLIDSAAFFPGAAPLRSMPMIQREIARQAALFNGKRLIPTNLAIVGSGTSVVIPAAPQTESAAVPQR